MDSSILQLFTVEEILDRIGQQKLTGCFHVFAPKESANLFFTNGLVVAAVKGKIEGEEIVRQVLEWKNARYFWEPNAALTAPALKPLQLDILQFLAKERPKAAGLRPGSEPLREVPRSAPPMPSVAVIPSRGGGTGPLGGLTTLVPAVGPLDLTATKTLSPSAEVRTAMDEALLKKHRLVLVSTDLPDQRHKIVRVSCLVGRSAACDIPIPHPSISRQHCLLQLGERGLHVKDLDTTNGTKVNGIVLREGYVNVGDKLSIGHLIFKLERDT